MKIITSNPVIRITKTEEEFVSNARGGGGGRRGGGGGRPHGGGGHHHGGFRGRRGPVFVGGYFWNGTYWIDPNGVCYTKNWLGQYVAADCGAPSAVELGL